MRRAGTIALALLLAGCAAAKEEPPQPDPMAILGQNWRTCLTREYRKSHQMLRDRNGAAETAIGACRTEENAALSHAMTMVEPFTAANTVTQAKARYKQIMLSGQWD